MLLRAELTSAPRAGAGPQQQSVLGLGKWILGPPYHDLINPQGVRVRCLAQNMLKAWCKYSAMFLCPV